MPLFYDDTTAVAGSSFVDSIAAGHTRLAPGGRLTLTSGTAVTTADVTGASTLYYTPYLSDSIALWTGSRWQNLTFAETSFSLGLLTTGYNYDVFGYLSSGVLALEKAAWTSDTARTTAVTVQDGRYCKSGDKTRLLLGTFRSTSTTATEDSAANRLLWSAYNRKRKRIAKSISPADYAYTTAAWRNANADATYRVAWLAGLSEDVVELTMKHRATCSASNAALVGLGVDASGSTTPSTFQLLGGSAWDQTSHVYYCGTPSVGFHFAQAQEQGAGSVTFSPATGGGITGFVEC